MTFILGSLGAAVVVGVAAAIVGTVVMLDGHLGAYFLIAVLAIWYSAAAALGVELPVPSRRWMVPRSWGSYGALPSALLFGAVLGAGFITIVSFAGVHLLLAMFILRADPWEAGGVMLIFGAVRSLPVALSTLGPRLLPNVVSRATGLAWARRIDSVQTSTAMRLARAASLSALAGSVVASVVA